ncbi:unnamed protein product [Blumeria hordei]|uniref:Uncharacterized protein n=1 Tax=Blumeria hordei TaxID=2867405 RepID=A0A383V3H5_BLUHO|nr:unnamed protein product [Blumeria hordei]
MSTLQTHIEELASTPTPTTRRSSHLRETFFQGFKLSARGMATSLCTTLVLTTKIYTYLAATAWPRRLNISWNVLCSTRVLPQFQFLLPIRQTSL